MTRRAVAIAWTVLLAAGALAAGGEIIERVVATVNGQPILQSDWDEAVRYEAFANQRPLRKISVADHKAALDRLIDQELLRQQTSHTDVARPAPEDVHKQIAQLRGQYGTAQAWQAALLRYGLTQLDVEHHVALQITINRLIDQRLRPAIHITRGNIEAYYREQLLPELRKAGVRDVPLVEVSPKIQEVLTQQQMNQLLTAWLRDLRTQSEIRLGGGGGVSAQ
jgi:hypothetical protein